MRWKIVILAAAVFVGGCAFQSAAKRLTSDCEPVRLKISYKAKKVEAICHEDIRSEIPWNNIGLGYEGQTQ